MNLNVSHNFKTKFTKMQLGKYTSTSKGKKLESDDLWPMTLTIADPEFKIIAKYSKENNNFEIEANGRDYFQLSYQAPNSLKIDKDEESIDLIKGKITCNGIVAMNTDGGLKKSINNEDEKDEGSPWGIDDL